MTKLYLSCRDKRFGKGEWRLELSEDSVQLFAPRQKSSVTFPRAEALDRFAFPSFWQSSKSLKITTREYGVLDFVSEPAIVLDIEEYLEGSLALLGVHAVLALEKRAGLMQIGGGILIVHAIGCSIAIFAIQPGFVVVLLGLLALGGWLFGHGRRLAKRATHAASQVKDYS